MRASMTRVSIAMTRGMVHRTRIQQYSYHYGMVCITGLFGCRWHRYQQSTRGSTKRDLAWFVMLVLSFLFATLYLYFWLVAKNDFDGFNWYVYTKLGRWYPYYKVLLGLTSMTFAYTVLLLVVGVFHVINGHQLYLHHVHRVILVVILGWCVAATVLIHNAWPSEWTVEHLSLQVTGPFLHVGAVVIMTLITWFIAGQWYTLANPYCKLFWLVVYISCMVALYVAPLFLHSPCIVDPNLIPPKPHLIAHRGASGLIPENTLLAFEQAAEYTREVAGFQADVQISHDGVPFLMRDRSLKRTTNVASVFPSQVDLEASAFNMSSLQMLDAGGWYLRDDPMGSVGSLSDSKKAALANQTIPTLLDLLSLVKRHGKLLLVDVLTPPSHHPHYNRTLQHTLRVIRNSGIPERNIWWMEWGPNTTMSASAVDNFTLVAPPSVDANTMKKYHVTIRHGQYDEILPQDIRGYSSNNVTSSLYLVNTEWFYSLYWCLGVDYVMTDMCHILADMKNPLWHMTPRDYFILWVTTDVVSAVLIVIIFIVQRIRSKGSSFNPEKLSLQGDKAKLKQKNRVMKEKLLYTLESPEGEIDGGSGIVGIRSTQNSSYNMQAIAGPSHMGLDEEHAGYPHSEIKLDFSG